MIPTKFSNKALLYLQDYLQCYKQCKNINKNYQNTHNKLRSAFINKIYLIIKTLEHKNITTTKERCANLSHKQKEEKYNKIRLKLPDKA